MTASRHPNSRGSAYSLKGLLGIGLAHQGQNLNADIIFPFMHHSGSSPRYILKEIFGISISSYSSTAQYMNMQQ